MEIIQDVSKYIYQFSEEFNNRISNCDLFRDFRMDNNVYLENGKTIENDEYQLNEIKLLDIDRSLMLKQIIELQKNSKEFQSFIRKIKKVNIL